MRVRSGAQCVMHVDVAEVNKTIHLSCYRVPKMKRFKADYFKKQNEAKGGGF